MREICIYAKPPIPGRTKSRLARDIGPDAAAGLAQALLLDACDAALQLPDCRVRLWHPPDSTPADFAGIVPAGIDFAGQQGADLGARMARTFKEVLSAGAERAILIGTDCVTHCVASFERAFAALARHQVVLEPADDGGYVLVGQSAPCAALFVDVQWGTDTVMATTRIRLDDAGIVWRELPETFDIDHGSDLPTLRAFLAEHPRPHTAAWLSGSA